MEWFELLQLIYGVMLSASVGVLAASGPPPLLDSQDGVSSAQVVWIWSLIAAGVAAVAFDAWYQFCLHGRLLRLEGRARGFIVLGLIAGMISSSFLPFQFLSRTLGGESGVVLFQEQPLNKLFGVSICITTIVELLFIILAANRSKGRAITEVGQSETDETSLPPANPDVITVDRFATIIGGLRFATLIVLACVVFFVVKGEHDTVGATVWIVGAWLVSRVLETVFSVVIYRWGSKA